MRDLITRLGEEGHYRKDDVYPSGDELAKLDEYMSAFNDGWELAREYWYERGWRDGAWGIVTVRVV